MQVSFIYINAWWYRVLAERILPIPVNLEEWMKLKI